MNKLIFSLLALAMLTPVSASALALTQDTAGFFCQGGELSITAGATFSAHCTGALYIERLSVLHADESITLSSTGNMTLWGTLVAPRITLATNADLSMRGGLFSGSPDYVPEVSALSHAGSASVIMRTFGDIVLNPIVDPVYGAVVLTQYFVEPGVSIDAQLFEFDPVVGLVPEPGTYGLFAAGSLLVIAVGLRRRRRMGADVGSSVPAAL